MSYVEIARKLGVHSNTIKNYAHEHGLVRPGKRYEKKSLPDPNLPPLRKDKRTLRIVQYRREGKTYEEIAELECIVPSYAITLFKRAYKQLPDHGVVCSNCGIWRPNLKWLLRHKCRGKSKLVTP